MKKIFILALLTFICIGVSDAAVRDNNTLSRATATQSQQVVTTPRTQPATVKTADRTSSSTARTNATTARTTTATPVTTSRAAVSRGTTRNTVPVSTARNVVNQRTSAETAVKTARSTVARAAEATTSAMSETRTGAEYEVCKNAYFTCMDQFCKLKNDDYRRCSCSDRVYDFDETRSVMQEAGTKLTEFTESLDAVSMSAAQAGAMRTASEGENALTADGSASKALLQAIMNSIRGGDTSVGGKYSDLNSISISFDTANAFGMTDAGQVIASYNGKNLYSAIYGQCRNAVREDCNDASLQRAVTAYLMAIEQDCNTVQSSITETQKNMKAAVREGSAMLDLARVENRQQRNSDDMTACLNNVEKAVLSEEVCGANYHKCLDNGEFIDLTTGKPIAGVVKFYELEHLLTFNQESSVASQRLSKISTNRTFVLNFEKRVKKFAEPALGKCVEKADDVWADYLDKALVDIYYAQKSKVAEIKQGCFDFVSACYVNGDTALTAAMMSLTSDASVVLQPDRITLNAAVCKEYVASCDNMFDGNIVQQYVDNRQDTDTLAACRAVVKQCFDKFGGTGYENFYYPYSGLFGTGSAADWFTLCDGQNADGEDCVNYKSECAKQLYEISSCSSPDMMRRAFGGFDLLPYVWDAKEKNRIYDPSATDKAYGTVNKDGEIDYRTVRSSGVATEIYYQIIDILNTQCSNVQGRFVELQALKPKMYQSDDICLATFSEDGEYKNLVSIYGIGDKEDMCPRGYRQSVDTASWGACLCWENGARRSKWGTSVKCVTELPTGNSGTDGTTCPSTGNPTANTDANGKWCDQSGTMSTTNNQVCPQKAKVVKSISADGKTTDICEWTSPPDYSTNITRIPVGIQ